MLIDDGKVLLRVVEAAPGRASTIVEVAGRISNKKGVSLPDTTIPTSAMTEKDRADLAAALEENIDWIALSFVQRPEDVAEVKEIANGRALVMAKIEKPQAVARLEEILEVSDAVMVARGDLGVEMPVERVPGLQKTHDPPRAPARQAGRRRDADAGIDDHLAGADPRRGLRRRDRGVRGRRRGHAVRRERLGPISARGGRDDEPDRGGGGDGGGLRRVIEAQRAAPEQTGADAIAEATRDVAETLELKVICAWTASGSTGLRIARERPRSSILALTPIVAMARRLAVAWGVHAVVTDDARDERDMTDRACRHAYIDGFVGAGERVIIVAGMPFGTPGATNNLRIATVGA